MKKLNKILCLSSIVVSIIYLVWRILFTIPKPSEFGWLSCILGVLLIFAELSGILMGYVQLLSYGENCEPKRPDSSLIPNEWYPHVDVFIATHNEAVDLLLKTVNGCIHMDYPDKSKVHIYICDDTNRMEVKRLAKKMGVGYLGVKDNKAAKAGNLNYALSKTDSPYIVTFDADMIPKSTFLMHTIPYFYLPEVDEEYKGVKMGFIQTPQSFYNPDLFQYNLYAEKNVPNEQNFFYQEINVFRNKSNTPIYGGSNTVISRECLEDVGGISEGFITEDFATGIEIVAKGYRCLSVSHVEANGLSPDSISSLMSQRERWGRGCIQTFKKKRIWTNPGLTVRQKISYFTAAAYWYTPIFRMIFILAPILDVLFQIRVAHCNMFMLALFWVPYFVIYNLGIRIVRGKIRNNSISLIYDTIITPHLLFPILLETVGLRKKKFVVTSKAKSVKKNRDYRYRIPFYILIALSVVAIKECLYQINVVGNLGFVVSFGWLVINLYSLFMSLLFMLGRKAFRGNERVQVEMDVDVVTQDGRRMKGKTGDISEDGMLLIFDYPEYLNENQAFQVTCYGEQISATMEVSVVHVTKDKEGYQYSMYITDMDEENRLKYYRIIYDRDPSLPKYFMEKSYIIYDFFHIIAQMLKDPNPYARKNPRVTFNQEVAVKQLKDSKVTIADFNYEYVVLKSKQWDLFDSIQELELELNQTLSLVCERVQMKNRVFDRKSRLYQVKNAEQFIQNEEFRKFILKKQIM